jgi:hypothetical protein
MYQVRKMHELIEREIYAQPTANQKQQRIRNIQRLCGFWGNILGMLVGFVCLIIGLVSSGRLPL